MGPNYEDFYAESQWIRWEQNFLATFAYFKIETFSLALLKARGPLGPLILYRDYKKYMEASREHNEMIPFLSIASREFEKDLNAMKLVMNQLEKRTHSENAYRFSERAQMAAGWWFYDVYVTQEFLQRIFQIVIPKEELSSRDKKSVTIKIVDIFQSQLKKNGSDMRVKMHGDIPFAAPWWSWLMR